jgi:hypothetical protein
MRLDSSGRLGLGTSSPAVGLHYRGDTPKLRIASSNTLEATAGTEEIGRVEWEGFKTSNVTVAASIRARQDGTWSTSAQWNAPSALEFYTQNNTGVEVTSPRLTINSSGRVGIGTTSPSGRLNISYGTGGAAVNDGIYLTESDSSGIYTSSLLFNGTVTRLYGDRSGGELRLENNGTGVVTAYTNGSERARIDSSGRLLVGTSTSAGAGERIQIAGGDYASSAINITRAQANLNGPGLNLVHTRSATYSSFAVLVDNDHLGTIYFRGDDGTDYESIGALIRCEVDGTPGANDMPGRLVFSTTADGASSPTERLRITNAGVLQVADAGNISVGTTTGTKIGTATTQKLGFYNATPVVQPAAVADATDAIDVITQLNDLLAKLRTLGIIAT